MKKSIFKYFVVRAFALAIIGCQTDSTDDVQDIENITFNESQAISGRYTVVYNNISGRIPVLTKVKSKAEYISQMSNLKATYLNEFKSIDLKEENIKFAYGYALKGFTADLTDAQVEILRKDPRVKSIEQDFTIQMGKPPKDGGGGNSNPQVIPFGTARVGGGTTKSIHTAWVIDTGIDLDHPDLNVDDTDRNISFLTGSPSNRSPEDQNGHGTHVAGTIAAIDNNIGSVGVAPGTTVVAVRVLDRRGSGSNSGVIAGVDYVAAHGSPGDVANMSLGGGVSLALDNAVIAAAAAGVKFSLAAGNSATDANNSSPARANHVNIYTISAMDSNDNWLLFPILAIHQ